MAISPLFDIYDPYGTIRQQADLGLINEDEDPLGIVPLGKRKPQITDLMPEEQKKSLLGTLAAAGSSGLAGLGWILDTPGAVMRGLLSGGPGKALSALWETSDDRVEGRELLRQYGMVGKDDSWGNFGGGLAAEMLLDPLTYLSFGLNQVVGQGAKTAAGKAAAKAGLLQNADLLARQADTGTRQFLRKSTPESLLSQLADDGAREAARKKIVAEAGEDALTQPLTRSNRTWLPGFGEGATDLYGEKAGDFLAWAGDQLGEYAMTNPVTGGAARRLTAAFDPNVMGQTDYARQWQARELSDAVRKRRVADRTQLADLQRQAEKSLNAQNLSLNMPEVSSAIRTSLEQGVDYVPEEMQGLLDLPGVRSFTDFFQNYRDQAPEIAKELGIPLDIVNPREGGAWVPRQQTAFDVLENAQWPKGVVPPDNIKRPYGRANKPVSLSDSAGKRRDYTSVVGSTDTLNAMSLDAELQDALRRATPEQTQDILRDWVERNLSGGEGNDLYAWLDAKDFSAQGKLDRARFQLQQELDRAGGPTKRSASLEQRIADLQEAADNPDFLHQVPDLPDTHPAVQQHAKLQAELDAAERSGELHRLPALQKQLEAAASQIPDPRDYYRDQMYQQLGNFYRKLDPQHARKGVPVFGRNVFNEVGDYVLRRGKAEAMGQGMLDILAANKTDLAAEAVEGGVNLTARDALKNLGYTDDAVAALEQLTGKSIDSMSFNKKFIDDWTKPMLKGRAPEELAPLTEMYDDFTKSFKTLALAWPSRLTRDQYSGAFAASMLNSFNPIDWFVGTQIRRGNYDQRKLFGLLPSLYDRIQNLPDFAGLTKEEAIDKFLRDAAGQGLGTSTFSDEALSGANTSLKEMFPGAAKPTWRDIGRRVYDPNRTWGEAARDFNPLAVRGSNGNRNPLLELVDRAAETTDAANRYGTYLNQVRQNADPSEAARIANLTQVNYSPEAFTDFERRYLKRIMPFYSYTRGITPLIADEIVNRPAGKMGQSIRAINRGGEPSEENFIPEYLRQSASVPMPEGFPLVGLEPGSKLKRFLTNIDLPFESAINLITPGTGNTAWQKAGNTLTKTALNLLGQTNPLIKGPLESITNRQFYSGRQLSDLYSMFEQTMGAPGRTLEQILVNAPGGSRLVGTARQLLDDRLDPQEKWSKFLVKALTGLTFHDVDMERTRRLAARDMLNELLSTTPGVRTYENITVPPEVLAAMPKQQQDMYLLYKIIQSEAAKRARDKKRAEQAAIDPLQLLGVVQNPA